MITPSLSNPSFYDMFNIVHIDEKWFYMSKPSKRYYLVPSEDEPLRTGKSKKFITKVMFLAAGARPRFDTSGNEIFLGKIGIFPFTKLEPAKCSSKNRVAGTMETKPILSVTKEVTRSWLIDKVIPAIRDKWPQASRGGFDIRLRFQPPNSPDLNVLDLGFFRAIQSLQEQEVLGSIDELVHAIQTSFDKISSHELNNVFLTLQTRMKEIMKVHGSNNYQTPHIGKGKLERQGRLLLQIECDSDLINEVVSSLNH
ncbi:uncharacterized protein LOC143557894 [Bidens hawaiensis]|uniref:uncharacterized protein LOC143557894 n=1 Tax=Bidens hawaiensis TaxID=980011 RepID=UPI00404B5A92